MFNGIIFNKGTVTKVQKRKKGINLFLRSNIKLSKKNLGLSISCDGVCLTLISYKKKNLEFYLSNETLKKSKFKNIKIKNLGYGPFVASFSLLQAYLKYIPIFNQIILFLCFIFDTIIQLFVRTKLKEIYPIGLFFEAQK